MIHVNQLTHAHAYIIIDVCDLENRFSMLMLKVGVLLEQFSNELRDKAANQWQCFCVIIKPYNNNNNNNVNFNGTRKIHFPSIELIQLSPESHTYKNHIRLPIELYVVVV